MTHTENGVVVTDVPPVPVSLLCLLATRSDLTFDSFVERCASNDYAGPALCKFTPPISRAYTELGLRPVQ